ncbi:Uncharacterized conserved protein, contains ParB-like and HNH nuclease domains [Halobiforma haloterrestris]|uniref:Uncharacterized conserved protein, contains ParB-like and HNH nuclease domains n=1 Tax=Natronobacterium haloterrestre TaxID=148448 RepID=A0A1I1I7K4_NATHA|nr:DUF262 domain-containing protein [Halobiforma haloterrestris]SFC32399.1 Uncharacterized conserved protein, contains ParB-like and HNH nuclease domains [Halobiforma haloterrestris]
MKADTLDLKDIFRKDTRYVVPRFQRPYVWSEEEHWQLLWEDLRLVVDELMERRAEASDRFERDEAQLETSPHFLGAIVLDQQSNPTRKLETREIIDGQQRLITLQVLLSAAHKASIDLDHGESASMLEKLMYNDKDLTSTETDRLKVWPIEADQDAFTDVMALSDPESEVSELDGDENLHECFRYFREQIRDWAEEDDQPPEEHLDALVTTLWHLLRIVVIDLESNDDAQVIFETLNARGTPLLAADLIKNYLFREATIEQNDPGELHDEYWKQFDQDEWREEVSQGRLDRPKIDVFIMHWLTMQMGQQVRAKKLFPAFRKFLDRTDLSTEEILQNIDYYSSIYEDISEPDRDTREGVFFHRLDVLDTTTPYPVLLWIFGQQDIPPAQRVKAIEAIESWLMRRMLCRLTSKNYNKIFIDLLEELKRSDDDRVGDKVVEFLHDKEGESDYWPTDDDLMNTMMERQYWARVNQRRLKMVFSAIERELRDTGYSETLEFTQDLEIEHILPQEWSHHWELPGEKPREVERIERDEAKNKIGNLTILTDKLNPSVSNAAWDVKREAIEEHTVLRVNRYLVTNWSDEWNENTIAERGKWLAEKASEVWAGPKSSYW